MGFIYFYSLGQRHQKGLATLLKNVIKQLFSFSLTTIFYITQIDTAYSLYCMYTVQYTRGGRFSQIKNRHMASVSFGISKSKKTNKLIYLSHTVPNMIWICAYTIYILSMLEQMQHYEYVSVICQIHKNKIRT